MSQKLVIKELPLYLSILFIHSGHFVDYSELKGMSAPPKAQAATSNPTKRRHLAS